MRPLSSNRQGQSVARNTGIKEARGEFIAFIDDDDVWFQNYPCKQVGFLKENIQFGAVISQIMLTDERLTPCFGPFPKKELESGWMFRLLFKYVPVPGSIVVRRSIFNEVGLFNPDLKGAEDWDLIFRIAQKFQIGFIPEIGVLVRQHSQSYPNMVENEEQKIYIRFRDTTRVFNKYSKYLEIKDKFLTQRAYW